MPAEILEVDLGERSYPIYIGAGLLGDAALQRLAGLVHCIDVGGIPVDEAPGLEMLIRGLQAQHADDNRLLAAAVPVFDACYTALQVPHDH